jgi:uncharacterized protein YacL
MAFLLGASAVIVGMLVALLFDFLISKTPYTPRNNIIRWILTFVSFFASLIICFILYIFIIYYLEESGCILSSDKRGWAMRNGLIASFICSFTLFRWIRK